MAHYTEKLEYAEYKAKTELKDSVGAVKSQFTTWRGDLIDEIIVNARAHGFEKGNTIIIEIIPNDKDFTKGLFTEV